MKLFLHNWYNKLIEELANTKNLIVVSPFVKEQILRNIANYFNLQNFTLITRYNLQDFANSASSLEALKFSVQNGASVYGVRNLHSKLYLFDERSAIISSANLTRGGLINNFECGVLITDTKVIQKLKEYEEYLKSIAGKPLSLDMCDKWLEELAVAAEFINTKKSSLPDYGATQIQIDSEKNYYVKFFGSSDRREPLNFSTKAEIDRALCHYACGFSISKKPRQINDGDIIYMARMTSDPNNFAIFGKAEAIKFVDGRDEATPNEIAQRSWKRDWPIYLRIKNSIFIDGTLGDCPFLYDLIESLDHESFATTKKRYENGEREINPFRSLTQQAYIKLTPKAVEWLEIRFQAAIEMFGVVDQEFIDNLPKSDTKV